MNGFYMVITIIIINVVYVSLFTIRLLFVMKGQNLLASILSIAEVFIYLIGLNIVLENIDKPQNLIAYCLGWGSGVYLGSKIEQWLALGYVTVQIVIDRQDENIPSLLRQKGFGVTSWMAEGREGNRIVMQVLAKRSNEKELLNTIDEMAPKAFVVSYEPRYFRGGFWVKRLP
ncbi:DUF2179 domain-containing protein [Schinkia azotoformans]|uniref:DUF2179 domain-containing protein n=1 Tax=Schinkia azotoformans TaxID=1454 RepID=UPI002DB9AA38|nr:DUF2179 domain-containing protein [Schinkia azotoformans]MEC1715126.1 DUF2179 domain-containing protein [Schinkia azotoformans]MEC1739824.1 DUF2179 domain-containing protein [Schinkia azotoformans]MEC1745551.1 DUF2179 domain-containing protein [Schinkia azotoformans]MEC1760067.1 DUF2179 domain-containing protein [Schinkia azotoformans]MEC1765051.1 DUF2179 domain-containing protein [Schinkia azotoformans]